MMSRREGGPGANLRSRSWTATWASARRRLRRRSECRESASWPS